MVVGNYRLHKFVSDDEKQTSVLLSATLIIPRKADVSTVIFKRFAWHTVNTTLLGPVTLLGNKFAPSSHNRSEGIAMSSAQAPSE